MSTPLFTPLNEIAQWKLVYFRFRDAAVDELVTYDELDALLARDFRADRTPIYRAIRELEDHDARTLAAVPRRGYRVVRANEHEGLARSKHRMARRAMASTQRKLASADRSMLTAEAITRLDRMEIQVALQRDMIRRLDARVSRNEEQVRAVREQQQVQGADVEARLSAVERIVRREKPA